MKAFVLLLMLTVSASAMSRLDALWMIETGGNDQMIGKAGEISRYQVRETVWRSVTRSRQYKSPETARLVAGKVMDKRIRAFDAAFRRAPTDFEYYALWNAPSQVMTGRIRPMVAERCQRFAQLCASSR
ncbi:MAG TPA: hypothetical protein VFC44_20475 [Candidatus Saccharimonadales bacterium]|nr:hypothetical protein [Candidatus Saccharimonadales bacterium]